MAPGWIGKAFSPSIETGPTPDYCLARAGCRTILDLDTRVWHGLEHDLRANASRLSRGKTGTHFSGSCSRLVRDRSRAPPVQRDCRAGHYRARPHACQDEVKSDLSRRSHAPVRLRHAARCTESTWRETPFPKPQFRVGRSGKAKCNPRSKFDPGSAYRLATKHAATLLLANWWAGS